MSFLFLRNLFYLTTPQAALMMPMNQHTAQNSPGRFEMGTHKWKMVCGHSFQNAKIPQAILYQRGKSVGFSLPHA